MEYTTAVKSEAKTASLTSEREPLMLQKRIGSTVYTVNVRFSSTSAETAQDIILRLIEREAGKNA